MPPWRSLTSVGVQSPRAFENVPEPVGAAARVMTASTAWADTYCWAGEPCISLQYERIRQDRSRTAFGLTSTPRLVVRYSHRGLVVKVVQQEGLPLSRTLPFALRQAGKAWRR